MASLALERGANINQLKNNIMTKQQIGQFIKTTRESKGLTYYNVFKASGVTNQVQQSIESATKDYTIGSLLRVCEALRIKLTWEIK